jgi:hypothetical protein
VKTWSYEPNNISDKHVDGSFWKNWVTSTTLCPLLSQHLMPQCLNHFCVTASFSSSNETRKWKGMKKLKAQAILKSRMFGVLQGIWIYSQHNGPHYMQLSTHKWNKYNNYIYHQMWQILTAVVFHSIYDVLKFIGKNNVLNLSFN